MAFSKYRVTPMRAWLPPVMGAALLCVSVLAGAGLAYAQAPQSGTPSPTAPAPRPQAAPAGPAPPAQAAPSATAAPAEPPAALPPTEVAPAELPRDLSPFGMFM